MKAVLIVGVVGIAGSIAVGDIAYGIDDRGGSNSQLVVWDTNDGAVTSLSNGYYKKYDLEASDINMASEWFVIGGGNGNVKDQVFLANKFDGSLTSLGQLGFSNRTNGRREVVSASFHNQSGRLWVFRERDGFYSFDTNDLSSLTKEVDLNKNVEAMAWNDAGSMLYYLDQKSLYSWSENEGAKLLGANLFDHGVESLEFDSNGNLLAGIEVGSSHFSLVKINLDTLALSEFGTYDSPSGDIESLAFLVSNAVPAPGALAILGIGGAIGMRRRRR